MTSIQVNNYTVIQLQKAYSSIQFKVQGASAYLDLVANTTVLSSGLQVFQDYNNQITALQADSVQIQFFGYSSRIPTTYVLDGTQVTSSVENYYQEPSMSFTMKTSTFQFSTGRTRMQCKNLLESDCEANLKRYLATNDSTYQFNMIIRFFKNGQMIKVMNQNVGAATESCFNEAVIKVEKQTLNIELGQAVSQCSLSGQKVNLVLNMSQTNLDTLVTTYQQFNSSVDFAYSYTIPLSTEQFSNLESYVLSPNSELSQMLMVYVEDVLMDYVSIDQLYISQEDQFKQEAKNLVVVVGIVSIIICVCQILAPLVIRKIAPIIQQRKQLKMKVQITNNDDM
ncbi:Hypothetical_protein [Hexamita inflata]|uniref:Hypothetical_protein n=1 Tax=Hexamita inflata TaxID=28002 RepID=A0AA86U657_9EUKA|nr:Hypothetical protein HINF_LOCUS19368 [Hexamita inflata]